MKEKNIKTKEPIMINVANTGNSGTMQKEKFDKVNRQEKIESYIERLSKGESLETVRKDFVEKFKDVSVHEIVHVEQNIIKKEELFFPKLCEYGYKGPSDVMWGVDDEIKGDISFLHKFIDIDNFLHYKNNLKRLIDRIKEMIYKEEKILFPLALNNFTKDDWKEVYADYDEMGYAFINDITRWKDAACWIESKEGAASSESIADAIGNGIIKMPTGELTIKQLVAMFAIIPIDFTFIDKDDILRFFTNNEKVFARTLSALGRKIYTCHPPRIIPVVEAMLGDFKTKCNDKMEMWIDKPDNPAKVIYHAVYDDKGEYIGTLEMVQSFKDAKEHFASK